MPRIVVRPALATLFIHGVLIYLLTANWASMDKERIRVKPTPNVIHARLVDVSELQSKPQSKPQPKQEPPKPKPEPPKPKPEPPKPKPEPPKSEPGKPSQNAFMERFNRTYRHEILDAYVFESLADVQALTTDSLVNNTTRRPHDSLGQVPPLTILPRLTAADSCPYPAST